MKAIVFSVEPSGMGKKILKRDDRGHARTVRKGRSYVRVVLGIFVGSDDIPRLTEMSSLLVEKIEASVEAAVNELQPGKAPARKIVMKGEQA